MFKFHFEKFTPFHKRRVMEFLEKLSLHSRNMLSISGVDPKTIYHSFREDWFYNAPVCLYHEKEIMAIGKLSEWENALYLSCLIVRDDLQGKGFGSKFVKYLLALSILNGHHKIYLEVRKDNPIGISFFKRMGFIPIKTYELTHLMEKTLT